MLQARLAPRLTPLHVCSAPHPLLRDVLPRLIGIFNPIEAIKTNKIESEGVCARRYAQEASAKQSSGFKLCT